MTFTGSPPSTQQSPSAQPPRDYNAEDVCGRCGADLEFDYRANPIAHACCACRDIRRVRITATRGEEGFGLQHPCPACGGGFVPRAITPAEPPEATAKRLAMGIDPMYSRVRLDDFDRKRDPAAYMTASAFVAKWPPAPHMLTLASDTKGNGKTTLAAAILNEVAIRHRVYGLFRSWPDLLAEMRATQRPGSEASLEAITEPLAKAPILVLDDVGVGRATDFADEQLYREVSRRYATDQPIVITTNTWTNLDARIQSRLSDAQRAKLVLFTGSDARPSLKSPEAQS